LPITLGQKFQGTSRSNRRAAQSFPITIFANCFEDLAESVGQRLDTFVGKPLAGESEAFVQLKFNFTIAHISKLAPERDYTRSSIEATADHELPTEL